MRASIFGWDLPPGCRVSDIPGNRPEDERWEAIEDRFWDKERLTHPQYGFSISEERYNAMDKIWRSNSKVNLNFCDLMGDYITSATEYGMEIGRTQERDNQAENKYYESEYHERIRNPKLRAFFKAQRQKISQLERMARK